jgi:predicted ferric reductase
VARARGPVLLTGLCLVPLALWAGARPLADGFTGSSSALTSVAVLFGLAGVSSFALNLVLGGRFQAVASFFGGLERLYRIHRINGRVAFVLLVTHALLMVAGRTMVSLSEAMELFSPAAGWNVLYGVIALGAMAVAIVLTLYVRLSHEVFVYVQRSFGFIFLIASLHVFLTPGTKAVSPALTIYLGVLATAGVAAFAYRSLLGDLLIRRRDYEVVAVNELDPSVVEITMSPRNGRVIFTPGQFLFVTFYSSTFEAQFHPFSMTSEGSTAVITLRPGDVHNQFHPFSITSAPDEPNLRITVKAVGDFTTALHKLDEGAAARIEGPYGAFSYLNVPNRRQIWIAGGIGVTPFLSMARSLKDSEYEIDLYYGMKSTTQGYFLDELLALGERKSSLRVIPFPEDELGFISTQELEARSGNLAAADILICGPPAMIDNLRSQLVAAGISERKIHFEKFGFGPQQS